MFLYLDNTNNDVYIIDTDAEKPEEDMIRVVYEESGKEINPDSLNYGLINLYKIYKPCNEEFTTLFIYNNDDSVRRIKLNKPAKKLTYHKDSKVYKIPVMWMVSDAVEVEGKNALDAVYKAISNIEALPANNYDAEYVDGTYIINGQDEISESDNPILLLSYLRGLGFLKED